MKKDPIDKSPAIRINGWAEFLKRKEWIEFRGLLNERKAYLEKQVVVAVGVRKYEDASRFEAKAREVQTIIDIAEGQLLKQEEENDAGN